MKYDFNFFSKKLKLKIKRLFHFLGNETTSSSSQSSKTDWTLLGELTSREALEEYLKNLEYLTQRHLSNKS